MVFWHSILSRTQEHNAGFAYIELKSGVALFLNLPSMCGILVVVVVNTLYLDSHRTPMSHLNSA